MATATLYLRSKETGKMATVWVRFTLGRNKDFRRPTSFKVPPEYWDPKKQGFKSRVIYTDVFTEKMRAELSDTFKEFKQYLQMKAVTGSREMSNSHLQTLIDKFDNLKTGHVPETLNSYIEKYIKEIEKGERLTDTKKSLFSPHTIKAYRSFQTQFKNYQKGRKRSLNFDDITIDFYDDFINFFYDKGYSPNSVGKMIKILKIMMRQAREDGHHHNGEFERKKFKVITVPTHEVYLTEDEMQRLYNLKLHNHKPYELARDVFLVGCYTAQRFSDYSRIRLSDIRENGGSKVIELTQQKTGERVIIPCKAELIHVLKRIGNNPPPVWEQKVNKYIKTVAWAAKIKDKVTKETLKGGLKTTTQEEKYKLIKTHTARRTGCTLMYLQKGIPVHDIMKISGHKTEREFLKYIRVSQEETAQRLATHSYFIGNPLSKAQ
ncbi:MAG TPA: site-specific integrase [Bacteroidales bacterium]|nr:site-specific integrase [Bacteroidales bacterium]